MMNSSAPSRLIFIAALHREIAAFTAGWKTDSNVLRRGIHLCWNDQAVVACAGMGARRAALAVEAALALGEATALISVGWAGACDPSLGIGEIVRADTVIDARTGERFFSPHSAANESGQGTLVTVAAPAGIVEKQRLRASYNAVAVDMEAATVARMARIRDVPFYAIKAISDDADFELPEMQRFTSATGQFREAAFALHLALRPRLWRPVMTMARGSKLAAERLHIAMRAFLESKEST